MRSNTRIKVTYPSILFFFFLYYICNTVTAREKSTRYIENNLRSERSLSPQGANLKLMKKLSLQWRYCRAIS